jgi:hypothetical protein
LTIKLIQRVATPNKFLALSTNALLELTLWLFMPSLAIVKELVAPRPAGPPTKNPATSAG